MLDVAKRFVDPSLFFRLNTIPNASGTNPRQAEPNSINIQEIVDIERVLACIEIVNTVQTTFIDTILDINVLKSHCKSILKKRDRPYHALWVNRKKKFIE